VRSVFASAKTILLASEIDCKVLTLDSAGLSRLAAKILVAVPSVTRSVGAAVPRQVRR